MATVEEVKAKLNALINNLSPQARRQLARNIGQALRKNQQARIARQENPDGTAFEPYEKANRIELHANKIPMVLLLRQENHVKNLAKRKAELNEKPCSRS